MRRYVQFLKFYLPLTYPNIIWGKMDKNATTVLDVGCGDGSFMALLNKDKKFEVTGIDAYKSYLAKAKKTGVYKKLILGDVRKLPFKEKSFDIVLCSQVIEHLKKEEGEELIRDLEKTAKRQVIVATTVGFFPYEPFEGKDENPLQVHQSGWEPKEFEKRGYKVYGQGAGFVYGRKRIVRPLPQLLQIPFFGLSYCLSPLFYFFPKHAAHMICVKNL